MNFKKSYKEKTIKLTQREIDKLSREATEKAFLLLLTIPCYVLSSEGYWEKTAKKRLPKFVEDVLSLYESVDASVVSIKELRDDLYKYTGVKIGLTGDKEIDKL